MEYGHNIDLVRCLLLADLPLRAKTIAQLRETFRLRSKLRVSPSTEVEIQPAELLMGCRDDSDDCDDYIRLGFEGGLNSDPQLQQHHKQGRSWVDFMDLRGSFAAFNDHRKAIVAAIISRYPQLTQDLATAKDEHGRDALTLTDPGTKAVMNQYLFFCSRYELKLDEPPVHVSDTSVLIRAVDHKPSDDYAAHFCAYWEKSVRTSPSSIMAATAATTEECTQSDIDTTHLKDHRVPVLSSEEQVAGCLVAMGLNSIQTAAEVGFFAEVKGIWGTEVMGVGGTSAAPASSYIMGITKPEFVAYCLRVVGATRKVVIKFMKYKVNLTLI